MQELARTYERRRTSTAVDAIFECQVRVANRLHQFLADDVQRIGGRLGEPVAFRPFLNTRVAAHLDPAIRGPYPAAFSCAWTGAATGAALVVDDNALDCNAALGNVNPATVWRSCDASSDNLDIDAAVAIVALPV